MTPRERIIWRVRPLRWSGRRPTPPTFKILALDPADAYLAAAAAWRNRGCDIIDAEVEIGRRT